MNERFFATLFSGAAPLLVWALHFFAAYALLGSLCCREVAAPLRGMLIAAGALAVAAIVVLVVRAWPRRASLRGAAALGCGALALVGVVWTTLPALALPPCSCG